MNIHVLNSDAPTEGDLSHRAAMDTSVVVSAVDDLMVMAVSDHSGRAAVRENATELGRVMMRLQLLLSSLSASAH